MSKPTLSTSEIPNSYMQQSEGRRKFLQQASLGSLMYSSLNLSTFGSTSNNERSPCSVLVLGAGAAGLTAALALKKQGHKVSILEYQNRIGGRLWSKELKNSQFTELGAGHFSNNGMPLINSLVDRYKLPRLEVYDGITRYVMKGTDGKSYQGNSYDPKNWPAQWGLNPNEQQTPIGATLIAYLNKAGITDFDAILDADWPDSTAIAKFGDMPVKQLLIDQGASPGFINLLNVHLGSFVGDGDVLDGLTSLVYFFYKKVFFRVEGGNERIAQYMANEFGRDNITLNSRVTSIDHRGLQVLVKTSDGRTFSADKVISTIPFKVIGEINVQPKWPAEKINLFNGITWIDGFKGVIQTLTPTWITNGNKGWPMASTDQSWNRIMDITSNETGGYGNAFFYVYRNEKLAQLKAINGSNKIRARTELLLTQFNASLNHAASRGNIPLSNNLINLNQVVTTDSIMWADGENVPWIKAALGVDIKPWMRDEWSKPEGNIHFAGDFTSYKSGWVEGALESGLRAASEIDPKATYF